MTISSHLGKPIPENKPDKADRAASGSFPALLGNLSSCVLRSPHVQMTYHDLILIYRIVTQLEKLLQDLVGSSAERVVIHLHLYQHKSV